MKHSIVQHSNDNNVIANFHVTAKLTAKKFLEFTLIFTILSVSIFRYFRLNGRNI